MAYPCPQCGADTALGPGTDALVCSHCGAIVPIEASATPVHEHDFGDAVARMARRPADRIAVGARTVECRNCGARAIVTTQAERCAFCDNALVVEVTGEEAVVPGAVLPFGVDKDRAVQAFQIWLRRRWFAPRRLAERARRGDLDGVYLPYWTFDSNTITRYSGARGEHYWVTEEYTDAQGKRQTRRVQKTRWYPAAGTVHVSFDDVLVCASRSVPRPLVEKLEPWDLGALRSFDGRYLAGFIAERYGVELDAGFQIAEERMEPRVRAAVRSDIGGDEQRIHSMSIQHHDVRFKHLLLPLWMSSYRHKDKLYRVVVNARTGEVAGERPWSWLKIAAFVLALALLALGIVLLVQYLQQPKLPPEEPYQVEQQVRLGWQEAATIDGANSGAFSAFYRHADDDPSPGGPVDPAPVRPAGRG